MKTKLLFLSLALMVMGGGSSLWGQSVLSDLKAAANGNPIITDFTSSTADAIKAEWTATNALGKDFSQGAKFGFGTWVSQKTSSPFAISVTKDIELTAGTYIFYGAAVMRVNGTYNVRISGAGSGTNSGIYVSAKDGDKVLEQIEISDNIISGDATDCTAGAGHYYVSFYLSETKTITVGFIGNSNYNYPAFVGANLYKITYNSAAGDYTSLLTDETQENLGKLVRGELDMSEAKSNLKDELDAANAIKTKWNSLHDATALFWVNETSFQNLSDAITTAQGIFDNSGSTDDDFTTQKGLLQTAEANITFNTPNPTKYYYLSLWGAYLNMSEVISNGGWSTNQAPYVYQFEAVESTTDQYKIKDANGDYLKSYSGGSAYKVEKGKEGTAWKITPALYQDTKRVQIENTLRSGYYLYFRNSPETGKVVYAGASGSGDGYYPYFDVTEATTTNVSMFISSSADWGTFVAPFAVDLTGDLAGVEAYTITTDGTTITKSEALSTIPANTPVLLHKTGGLSATNVSGYAQSYYTGQPQVSNLVGTLAATTLTGDGTIYLLQKKNGKLGWYKLADADVVESTANRAYLKVEAGGGEARQFLPLFEDDETTGISQIENGRLTIEKSIYNLNGQRVQQPTKGLYIVGGKKIIVK